MKKILIAAIIALMPCMAHAGVKSAFKAVGTEVATADFVAAYNTSRGIEFMANRVMFNITDRLGVTAGVDVRSEFEFASGFSNVGIGSGLRFVVRDPFSIHAGYSYRIMDFGAKSSNGPGSFYGGVAFHF